MPSFNSNDPRTFGWPLSFKGFVPFRYGGFDFPQGVHPLVAPVFREALDRLRAAGWKMPSVGLGLAGGMWGQEFREITGGGNLSFHSWGLALDLAAPWNPWGAATPDASPYRLPSNTSAIVEPLGLLWGGGPRWGSHRDWMHLQNMNSPIELGQLAFPAHPVPKPGRPFPLASRDFFGQVTDGPGTHPGGPTSPVDQTSVTRIQHQLKLTQDGLYGPLTAGRVKARQSELGLSVDGKTGPVTWARLFPG